ncbi:hypothetical protein, partial [Streptomyces fradiae]|uniref:hypothetical protein n=1 Tax=Streptomyces fradiae TaxID=1906 RepID=UPI000AC731D6
MTRRVRPVRRPVPGGLRGRPGWTDPFSVPSGWRLGGTPAWTPHPVGVPGHEPVTVHVRGPLHDAEIRVGGAG